MIKQIPVTDELVRALEDVDTRVRIAWRLYWKFAPAGTWRDAWRMAGTFRAFTIVQIVRAHGSRLP
jgi:hypothetical protein